MISELSLRRRLPKGNENFEHYLLSDSVPKIVKMISELSLRSRLPKGNENFEDYILSDGELKIVVLQIHLRYETI